MSRELLREELHESANNIFGKHFFYSKIMEIINLLHYATREELRRWLEENKN